MGNVRDEDKTVWAAVPAKYMPDDDGPAPVSPPTIKFETKTIQVPKKIQSAIFEISSWDVDRAIVAWVREKHPEIMPDDEIKVRDNTRTVAVEITRNG